MFLHDPSGRVFLDMEARRDSIPPEERCEKCDGHGKVRVGCAITHAIYGECMLCFGTGRKDKHLVKSPS